MNSLFAATVSFSPVTDDNYLIPCNFKYSLKHIHTPRGGEREGRGGGKRERERMNDGFSKLNKVQFSLQGDVIPNFTRRKPLLKTQRARFSQHQPPRRELEQ